MWGILTRYKVDLDGRTIGRIANGSSLDITAEPGEHVLRVRDGLYRSSSISFILRDEETLRFVCGTRIVGVRLAIAWVLLMHPSMVVFIAEDAPESHPEQEFTVSAKSVVFSISAIVAVMLLVVLTTVALFASI